MSDTPNEVEFELASLAFTEDEQGCVLYLQERNGNRFLPIWVGHPEGQAIAVRLSGLPVARPLTHDLLLTVIERLGSAIQKVVVSRVDEDVRIYARIHLDGSNEIDARPSDAIALAVRAGCSIYIHRDVLSRCAPMTKPGNEDDFAALRRRIGSLTPEDIFRTQQKRSNRV